MNTIRLGTIGINMAFEIHKLIDNYPELKNYGNIPNLVNLSNQWQREMDTVLNKEVSHD